MTMSNATIILLTCVSLGVILASLEFRRSSRLKVLRMAASVLMMVSLYFILTEEGHLETSTGIVLITPGTPDSVKTLVRKRFANRRFIEVSNEQPYGLANESYLDSVLITGNGLLTNSDIEQLHGALVKHLTPELPEGIHAIIEPDSYTINSPSTVEILVSEDVSELLVSDGNKSDTVGVDSEGRTSFDVIQKVAGPIIYSITGLDASEKILFRDELPIQIFEARQLSIAMLNAFPLAELNYLKNHLGAAGHKVTSSIQLSTDLYSWDFINTEVDKRAVINRLDDFDAIFMTSSYLNSLPRSAINQLNTAVKNGLGLFVWRDAKDYSQIRLSEVTASTSTTFSFDEMSLRKYPFRFEQVQIPLFSSNNQVILASGADQRGTITESLVSDSYSLLLNGDSLQYREFWNLALESVVRPKTIRYVELSPLWQRQVNYPMNISIQADELARASIDGIELNIDQDHLQSDIWRMRFYPSRKGWHTLTFYETTGVDSLRFYVGADGWQRSIARSLQKRNEHLDLSARSSISGASFGYLWIVVLGVCLVFLWAEPRFG